jgi:hypothetical protein
VHGTQLGRFCGGAYVIRLRYQLELLLCLFPVVWVLVLVAAAATLKSSHTKGTLATVQISKSKLSNRVPTGCHFIACTR